MNIVVILIMIVAVVIIIITTSVCETDTHLDVAGVFNVPTPLP